MADAPVPAKEMYPGFEATQIYKQVRKRTYLMLAKGLLQCAPAVVALWVLTFYTSIVYLVLAAVFLFFGGRNMYRAYTYLKNPAKHPSLAPFFTHEGTKEYVDLFEKETSEENGKTTFKSAHITNNFIVSKTLFHLNWTHYTEIVWAYKHKLTTWYYFIPVTSWSVFLYTTRGTSYQFECKSEQETEQMLLEMARRAPFAIYGHSTDLMSAWSNGQLIAEVVKRREDYLKNPKKFLSAKPEATEKRKLEDLKKI